MATIRKRGGTYQIRVSLGYDKNCKPPKMTYAQSSHI